ncbi:lysophospholipid acyltransferase family protein [Halioxenophilus sp. WMMB6]|uniref:lysophospholipid acyltransferase family protein n=1 Tax=Halioxenophilus sp. WMMB6 TaxID=3073815 RepID=UPI00295F1654|nr:lysophospholipid acyltransferase family protein [Halioxenophilus sp. WMMB6]
MNLIRSTLFNVYYTIITITIGLLALVAYRLLPKRASSAVLLSWNHAVIHGLRLLCGVRFVQHGQLPAGKQNYVIMAKHQSAWETFYLQTQFPPLSTILKQELLRVPIFGWGLRLLEPVAIDRANPIQALKQVKEQGIDRIRRGRNLMVFPEGTRMAPGENGKYARSGAEIAIATGVPIIPVAHNAGHCWLNKRFVKQPGLITVVVGPPIPSEGKTSRQLTDEVRHWIVTEQAKIEPPAAGE